MSAPVTTLPQPDEITASVLHAMGWSDPFPAPLLWVLAEASRARAAVQPGRLGLDALAVVSALARYLCDAGADPAPAAKKKGA